MVRVSRLTGIGGWLALYIWVTLLGSLFFLGLTGYQAAQGKLTMESLAGTFLLHQLFAQLISAANLVVAFLLLFKVPNIIFYINLYLGIKVIYWVLMAIASILMQGMAAWKMAPFFILYALWNAVWHEYFEKSDRILTNYYK